MSLTSSRTASFQWNSNGHSIIQRRALTSPPVMYHVTVSNSSGWLCSPLLCEENIPIMREMENFNSICSVVDVERRNERASNGEEFSSSGAGRGIFIIKIFPAVCSLLLYTGTAAIVQYSPMTELDYGTLLCSATNKIGKQKHPCIFHIIAAGTYPRPVQAGSI